MHDETAHVEPKADPWTKQREGGVFMDNDVMKVEHESVIRKGKIATASFSFAGQTHWFQ